MKKKVFLTLTLTIPLIVACSSYGPTPKLYTQFEKASLKTRVAEKYEWQLKEIGNEFSYVFDFDHSQTEGKPDHFLRVFYNNQQVYEEITEQDYSINSAFSNNDCSFYVCSLFDETGKYTLLSCLAVDKTGQSYRFSLPYNNYCSGACTDGSCCYFLLNERVENSSRYLYKTDLHGNFIESNTVSDRFNQLHFVNNSIFTVSWTYKYDTKDDSLEVF